MSISNEMLHGKVIDFKDLNKLIPVRDKFLDEKVHSRINNDINRQKTFMFMPNSTYDNKPMQDAEYKKSKYKLVLFGVDEAGSKRTVCINDIEPYFEIGIPKKKSVDSDARDKFATWIFENLHLEGQVDFNKFIETIGVHKIMPTFGFKIEPTRYEIVSGKPLHGFQEHESYYVKIYFNKLQQRKDAINYVRALKYSTFHDDLSSYYRVVSRDYLLQLANWMTVSNYYVNFDNKYIKGDVIMVSINDIVNFKDPLPKHLLKDNTMTMAFDIETFNPTNNGDIPMPEYADHVMFMISMAFQWYHADDQLLQVCLVDVPSKAHPDFLTIVCGTEENLIRGFAQICAKMQPEIYTGFNSDGYDWKWIVERAAAYEGLLVDICELLDSTIVDKRTESSCTFNFRKSKHKIEADTDMNGQNLQLPGYIPCDVMIIFRKLYPKSEVYSLNFFLSANKLGGKEDMPYHEMFRIYRETLALHKSGKDITDTLLDEMSTVAKYCVVDSIRCHDLLKMRTVLQDRREMANLSYTSIYDSFYYADGMKVRNLVLSESLIRNLKLSNISSEKVETGKYPGAWVFPPIKGLIVSKLSIAERIEKCSLGYDEYAGWENVTDDDIQTYKEIIEKVGANPSDEIIENVTSEHNIPNHFIKMLQEPIGRPITGLDYSSLYPSLMMCYNFSPEYMITNINQAKEVNAILKPDGTKKHTLHKVKFEFNERPIRGWSVRHDNKLDPESPDFKFGLFPYILKKLFDARKKLKKGERGLGYWEHKLEQMKLLPEEERNTPKAKEEYEDALFAFNTLDSKQKALKVLMNCFYGESGNKISPLFMLQVAGGITTAGRDNIKRAYEYVKEADCKVYYGDSVPADEPILIRYTTGPLAGNIDIRTIDDIPYESTEGSDTESIHSEFDWDDKWYQFPQFKPDEVAPIRINKQMHYPVEGLETWTASGWSPIRRIIRHQTNKEIYRVNTHGGCVDVTEDHSLLTNTMESLSPKDAKIGDELCHGFPTEFPAEAKFDVDNTIEIIHCTRCNSDKPSYEFYIKKNGKFLKPCKKCAWIANSKNRTASLMENYFSASEYLANVGKNISEEEAYVWGAFHADGSCGMYKCPSGNKCSWAINKQDLKHLDKLIECLKICEPNIKFKILDTMKSSSVYKLVPNGMIKIIVEKYRKLFYDKRDYKIVPMCILNSPLNIRQAYWDGFYAGDGYKNDKGIVSICQKGKINTQCIYYLMKSIGYNNIAVYSQEYKPDIYWLSVLVNPLSNEIKKLRKVDNNIKESYIEKNEVDLSYILSNTNINESTDKVESIGWNLDKDTPYVYDIETTDGTFLPGVGNLICLQTDSLYLAMPEKEFKQLDIDYYTEKISKLEYWKRMIEITFETIVPLNKNVNKMLEDDNGTKFLNMAYEESLYPCAFLAKKKYLGIPHISEPNFNLDKNGEFYLFIRGLALKTRGVSEVLINVSKGILQSIVNHANILTIIEIVQKAIDDFYKVDWSSPELFQAFIMTDVFKPNKQNVRMHTFHDRMIQERGIEIIPGERNKYVIVKKYPYKFDLRGRKTALSVGDMMEPADVAFEEGLPIDVDYYIEKKINGQLARFITYHDDFHVPVNDYNDTAELKKAEEKNLTLARKFVNDYSKKYFATYSDKGRIYKNIFKKSALIVKNKIIETCGNNDSSNLVIKLLGFSVDPNDDLETWLTDKIHSVVEKKKSNIMYGENYINNLLKSDMFKESGLTKQDYITKLQMIYYSTKNGIVNISATAESQYNDRQQILETRFRNSLNTIKNLYNMQNSIIDVVSKHIKTVTDIDNKFNTSSLEVNNLSSFGGINSIDNLDNLDNSLNDIAESNVQVQSQKILEGIAELKYIYFNLISNYEYIYQTRSIVEHLKTLMNKKLRIVKPPSKVDMSKMIEQFTKDSVAEGMNC